MNIVSVLNRLKNVIPQENILVSEPMKKHTSFKIGGPADIFVFPQDEHEISFIVKTCNDAGIPYYLIGNGSNILVRDKGIRGVVINTSELFDKFNIYENIISAQSGILLSKLANAALQAELTGMEFASGIPGTLGGAVFMNAGAYGSEMKDIVIETEYLKIDGTLGKVTGEAHKFGYRQSIFQQEGYIILQSKLMLKKGNKQDIKTLMNELSLQRNAKQPMTLHSAGSVFKRPQGFYAGKLIEDCGLKGARIGGAQVSERHAGFIVNTDNATAQDVIRLIYIIKDKVKQKFNIELQTEIKIIGEE